MTKAKQVGKVLVATGQPRARPTPVAERFKNEELPPGVILEVSKLVPAAHEAFTPEELEARIAAYRARAKDHLPLPLFGEPQPDVPDFVADSHLQLVCWACGVVAPREGSACLVNPARGTDTKRRFVSRKLSANLTETYCPECFEVWGWPDEYLAEVERLNNLSESLAREEGERLAGAGVPDRNQPAHGGSTRRPGASRAPVGV